MNLPRIATYRLQFRSGMTFDRAAEIVPYLRRLGISHLYASPIFKATSGSTHGYDIVDYNRLDPALGGEAGFERLHAALRDHGLGLLLDIVPNHMAASLENRWWASVIEHGPDSPYAGHFDIDWRQRLTLPMLERDYGEALAAGEIGLALDEEGKPALRYLDTSLPLNPSTLPMVAERLGIAAGQLSSVTPQALAQLSRDREFIDRLHGAQSFRLIFWKNARGELSYRRFFEITGLVGVRVECEPVFDDIHRLVLDLVRAGMVQGLRVDHVDGLALPTRYLRRLRQEVGPEFWLLVEKILARGETLPPEWEGCGTTGYEFIPACADLLADRDELEGLAHEYAGFVGGEPEGQHELREVKLRIVTENFAGELRLLAEHAAALAGQEEGRAAAELRHALAELITGFEVYRTYSENAGLSPTDDAVLDHAMQNAKPHAAPDALRFIAALLRGQAGGEAAQEFRLRFQQLTGPVMAKAVEDTFFYRRNLLLALNEVGCAPDFDLQGVEGFHRAMQARLQQPVGLLATSTHDTKLGEDSRARLLAIPQMAAAWGGAVQRWQQLNAVHEPAPGPRIEWQLYQALAAILPSDPDPADRPALWRLGERFISYVGKALREAKEQTDWLEPDEAFEAAVQSFAGAWFEADDGDFLADFSVFLRQLQQPGAIHSLSQTLAKLTAPGVPDFYQGTEQAGFALADPDNRRPVDFAALEAGLAHDPAALRLPGPDQGGSFRQWMIARVLAVRSAHPALFLSGDYLPITGTDSRHYPAFLRELDGVVALVVLQRLSLHDHLPSAKPRLYLPQWLHGMQFHNVLADASFIALPQQPLSTVLAGRPVSLALSVAG